jgi:SAM-dependent methyltransferase
MTTSPGQGRLAGVLRYLPLFVFFSLAAFVAGIYLVAARSAPPIHPLTGRQIAGIATDAAWMDRAARESEEDPERALDLIGVASGMVVADVGAGSGYMTVRLARRVGPSGTVLANDVQPALLTMIRDKARALQITNIRTVQGTESDARLPEGTVDLALLVDVYHEFRNPQAMLQSIRRALKPGGRLVLVEYRKEDPRIPIAPTHRMSVAEARTEVEAEGFAFDRLAPGLPRQHIIEFRRAGP